MRDHRDLRHGVLEFQERPPHVVIGGDQPERAVAFGPHPRRRFPGVAGRVVGAVTQHHTARHLFGRLPGDAQQLGHVDPVPDAGDEELLGPLFGQQLEAGGEPSAAAGQHHDGVGRAHRVFDPAWDLAGKPDQSACPGRSRRQQRARDAGDPAPSAARISPPGAGLCHGLSANTASTAAPGGRRQLVGPGESGAARSSGGP